MVFGIEPFLPWPWLLGSAVLAFALCIGFYRRWRHFVSPAYWRLLLATKMLAIAACFLLLLNPYRRERQPDDRTFSVVFLVDATGSMDTKDCDGETRLQLVKDQFLDPASSFQRNVVQKIRNHRFYLFAGDRQYRIQDTTSVFSSLPGDTDIAMALERTLELGRGPLRLGAVVLLSDGRDNRGVAPVNLAGNFREAGVPIHSIGVGSRQVQADLAVAWTDVPRQAIKGRALELKAEIRRSGPVTEPVTVRLFEGDRQLMEQRVSFDAGQQVQPLVFPITSFLAGFKTYRLIADPLVGEENQLNNVDYLGLQVQDPDEFKVLYFSGALTWDFRFLRMLAESQERLHLAAVVRVGHEQWFRYGFPEDEAPTGLPALAQLNQYDCLVMDLSALALLNEAQVKNLHDFVAGRGGGLIVSGVASSIPEHFASLLPLRRLDIGTLQLASSPLNVRPTGVLIPPSSDPGMLAHLYLPGQAPFLAIRAEHLKPAAKSAVTVRDDSYILLANQNYGSGKVVLANLPATWRWVMDRDFGAEMYANYWGRLISWVSSSSRDRLTLRPHGAHLPLNQETEITLDLLTDDFAPARHAEIRATVLGPAGEESLPLFSSVRVDGRYIARFIPREPGEYRLRVRAVLGPDDVLEGHANYLAVNRTAELEPGPIDEAQLQSLARVTGGRYWHYKDAAKIRELPLANELQYLETRSDLRNRWWFLLALLAFIIPDWVVRRRIGLR